jgi:hypothetical protein
MSRQLSMNSMDLQGGDIPSFIFSLPNLNFLALGNTTFKNDIPKGLSKLTGLTHLDLTLAKYTGNIPRQLSKLVNLRFAVGASIAYNDDGLVTVGHSGCPCQWKFNDSWLMPGP